MIYIIYAISQEMILGGKKVQIGNLKSESVLFKDRVCIRIKTEEFFFHETQKKTYLDLILYVPFLHYKAQNQTYTPKITE